MFNHCFTTLKVQHTKSKILFIIFYYFKISFQYYEIYRLENNLFQKNGSPNPKYVADEIIVLIATWLINIL